MHFVWAIDYFEEGLNSRWLLPNRLYEGVAHGAVPIALADVATGDWLRQRGVGLLVDDSLADLSVRLRGLDAARMSALQAGVRAIPPTDVLLLPEERDAALNTLLGCPADQSVFSFPAALPPTFMSEAAS